MKWPFVSAARYADREREVLELRRELAEVKARYDRVIDEINFRSTGFHLFERFEKKEETPSVVAAQPAAEPTGIAAAIDKVGRRPTAIRQYLESQAEADILREQKEFLERQPAQAVQAQIEEALKLGSEKAAKAAQA